MRTIYHISQQWRSGTRHLREDGHTVSNQFCGVARESREGKSWRGSAHISEWFNGGLMGFNQQNGGFNGIYPVVN